MAGAKARRQPAGSIHSPANVHTAAAAVYDDAPFGNPYISEEEMEAFNQEFRLMDSFTASAGSGYNEPIPSFGGRGHNNYNGPGGREEAKVSAAPMEHLSSASPQAASTYLCPKCREGHLRPIKGRNGSFWGCSNYPRCTATFDDEHNMPVFNS